MEDDDDEENFESVVYGQGEANQDTKKNRLCYLVWKRWDMDEYVPVQDDAKLEDADTNQLSHGVYVVLKRFFHPCIHVMVCMANIRCLCDFLQI
jgi:hypothetical protein